MTTAVDTNVLLDVLTADPEHAASSRAALARARVEGSPVLCKVVYAELAAAFAGSPEHLDPFLSDAGLRPVRTPEPALAEAGRGWPASRGRGGSRSRVLADFLVAAHGLVVLDPHPPDGP